MTQRFRHTTSMQIIFKAENYMNISAADLEALIRLYRKCSLHVDRKPWRDYSRSNMIDMAWF